MILYAIGIPGRIPRLYANGNSRDDIMANVLEWEVVIPVTKESKDLDLVINQAGDALEPREIGLQEAQDTKWAHAKRVRAMALTLGCWTPKGMIDVSSDAIDVLTLYAVQSLADPNYHVVLTMYDNSFVDHSAAELMTAIKYLSRFVAAVHQRAVDLRVEIYKATTVASVQAIEPREGWPEIDEPIGD